MDGAGFPYLSPTCYWYIVEGEDRALLFVEEGELEQMLLYLVDVFCHSPSYFCFIFILLKELKCTNRCEFGNGTGIHFEHSADLWNYHFINNRFHNLSPAGILMNLSLCR